ncbi:MAG: radical SAM protein [Patescibacteria group bacterium]
MSRLTSKVLKEISYQTGSYTITPEFVSLILTMKCNFHCQSCSIWQKTNHDELNESAWKNIIEQLKINLKPETFIELNGGEALLRKDLVIFCIKELKKHFYKVVLNTNGLLINQELLNELKLSSLDAIKLSLYSLNSKNHNDLRGHENAYEHAINAVKLINKSEIDLEIGLLITSKNISEAPKLIQYLQTLPKTSIILQPLDEKVESVESKKQNSNNLISYLWPTPEQVKIFIDWVLKNRSHIKNPAVNIKVIRDYYLHPESVLKYRCFAGQRNLVIYPNGDVSFCFKHSVIGNPTKQNLISILQNAKEKRRAIKHCKKYCRIIGCNFSRGFKEFMMAKIKL